MITTILTALILFALGILLLWLIIFLIEKFISPIPQGIKLALAIIILLLVLLAIVKYFNFGI